MDTVAAVKRLMKAKSYLLKTNKGRTKFCKIIQDRFPTANFHLEINPKTNGCCIIYPSGPYDSEV